MYNYNKQRKTEEQPKQTGQFVPIDARKQVAKELKSTHFFLGTDQADFRSKNQIAQSDQNWNIDQEEKQLFNKFSQNIKQSHIQLGPNNKPLFETTNSNDYNKKDVDMERVQAAIETKKDLRKAHFQFGSQNQGADGFVTTNMERFKKNSLAPSETTKPLPSNGPDKFKSAGNKIFNGNEKTAFKTSAQEALVTHDLKEAYKNLQQQQEQGKSVRKHNFQFGYNGEHSLQSEYQHYQDISRAKSVAITGPIHKSINDSKRSNIEIGSKWQPLDYTSQSKMTLAPSYHQIDENLGFNPAEAAAKAKQDLRKSHFLIGTAAPLMESSAQGAFKNMEINNEGANQKIAIQSKMQRGNFKIGDNTAPTQFETTYNQGISGNKPQSDQVNAQDQRRHLFGSINFGSQQNEYVSEAKSKFIQQQSEKDNSLKQLIDKNRNNNFKFGDGLQHEVTSVTKANYDYKGNQAKAGLNEAQKADLKTHHFQMGSHTAEYQTSAQQINKDQPQNGSGAQKIEAKSLLKNSGQRIFGSNGGSPTQNRPSEYKTTNQSYLKWIQPEPTQLEQFKI